MKKQLIAIVSVVVLAVCMAGSAFAASGISADEQALYNTFCAAVDKWAGLLDTNTKATNGTISNQYKAEAQTALTKVDLDAAACADLTTAVNEALALVDAANPQTGSALRAMHTSVVDRVNQTAKKYGMTVAVDPVTGYATVTVNGSVVATTKPSVNQTGANTTGTFVVLASLVAVLGVGIVLFNRKRAAVK